jgi:hypothetical protein
VESGDVYLGSASFVGTKQGSVSPDGAYVFFTTASDRQIYVREHGNTTIQVSASHRAIPDPKGHQPAEFRGAAGAKAIFLSSEALTDDATPLEQELYEFDAATGELTDLSVDHNEVESPQIGAIPGTVAFSGPGNVLEAKAPVSKVKRKPVKHKRKANKRKAAHGKSKHRRAHKSLSNRARRQRGDGR